MNRRRALLQPSLRSAEGMSLIEVVIAIAILGVLTTASLGVYLSSTSASLDQQRRQVAITVANESMEIVSGWSTSTVSATGASALFTARPKGKVDTLWAANTSISGVNATYKMWDSTASASSTPALPAAIPLSRVVSRGGTNFTAQTLIGFCLQPLAGGNCAAGVSGYKPNTIPAPPVPAGYTQLTRVIVVVRWTAGCPTGGCSYTATTLIDLHGDLEWKGTK